jgi:murein DD-endopeptidase MepM/ murein hydrolase activator NlpD
VCSSDLRVIASSYSKANGNYVFIQHGGKYTTKYLHLTKRFVQKGSHVSQGKTIGTVGSTGYATGPHLHYEFLVNGVHRNPRTVKLPDARTIAKNQRHEFVAQTTPLLNQLSQHSGILIAQAKLQD